MTWFEYCIWGICLNDTCDHERVKNNNLQCESNVTESYCHSFFLKARWNWYKLKKDYFMLALKICNEDLITNISPKRFVLGEKVIWATEWPGLDVVNHQPMNKWSL